MSNEKHTPKKWEPGCEVRCPCCGNTYETSDYVPFSVEQYDLHDAAKALLEACKAALTQFKLDADAGMDVYAPMTAVEQAIAKAEPQP
jgi:hypothetical protein